MAEAQRYAFETSFDDLDKLSPGETVFTKAAEERGYSQGFAEGHLKGVEEGHGDVLSSVQNMAQKLTQLGHLHEQALQGLKEEVVKTSYLMLKSLFPKYAEAFGHKEITSIIESALKEREGDRHIKLFVSSNVQKPLEEAVDKLKNNGCDFGEISIQSDGALDPMGCRIQWESGGCEVLISRIQEEIKQAASRVISLDDLDAVETAPSSESTDPSDSPNSADTQDVQDERPDIETTGEST